MIFRFLSLTATKSVERNNGKINNAGSSGMVGAFGLGSACGLDAAKKGT